jgi:colanic acid/amylovoran biosynthesis glycosyltransferase
VENSVAMNPRGSQRRMKYLNIVSIFPSLTETFVFRELRTMQQLGCEVVIGQLRPAGRRPTASGFEDLRPCVVPTKLFSLSTLAGILFFALTKPKHVWTCIKTVIKSLSDTASLLKLTYILLVSMGLAYRLRERGILHVRGHHLHSEAVSAMFIAGFLGIPYSFTCHTVKAYYPRRVLVEVIRKADFILANICQVKEFLHSLGASDSQVQLVRNGVPLREFPMRKAEPYEDPPIILAVGRLDYKKGFHVLVSACAILRDEGMRFRCVIAGNGDEWNSLLLRRKALALEKHVDLLGSLEFREVQRWYERATLLAVPSIIGPDGSTDGMPTVIIEAFARGVPVVGSSTAGIPEVIHNGVNGFVVPAGSSRELANRMKELILDQDTRGKFAGEARHTVERDFDLERNVRVIADLVFSRTGQVSNMASPVLSPDMEHLPSAR